MAVAFGSSGAVATGGSSLSVAYPSGLAAGDMLTLHVASKVGVTTFAVCQTPSGWTSLGLDNRGPSPGVEGNPDEGEIHGYLFWKIADGTESGSLSVTFTNDPGSCIGIMSRYTTTGYWVVADTNGGCDGGASVSITGNASFALASGDIIVASLAANTDAYSYASHVIALTGATIATPTERNDSGTANGTDCALVVVDAACTSGSGTAAPVWTTTASGSTAAAPIISGSFLRLREGTGISFVAAGAVAAGSTSLSVAYPTGLLSGDKLVLCITNKYPTNGPSTPAGWTAVSNNQGSGGVGAAGADSGTVYSTVFHKTSNGTETGNVAVTITSGNSSEGIILAYRAPSANTWSVAAHQGADNTAGTAFSVTCGGDPGLLGGDMVIVCAGTNTDARTYSAQAVTATGISAWGTVVERADAHTTTGDDSALVVSEHPVTTGTSSAAPVFVMTASGTTANQNAGSAVVFRMRSSAPAGGAMTTTSTPIACAAALSTATLRSIGKLAKSATPIASAAAVSTATLRSSGKLTATLAAASSVSAATLKSGGKLTATLVGAAAVSTATLKSAGKLAATLAASTAVPTATLKSAGKLSATVAASAAVSSADLQNGTVVSNELTATIHVAGALTTATLRSAGKLGATSAAGASVSQATLKSDGKLSATALATCSVTAAALRSVGKLSSTAAASAALATATLTTLFQLSATMTVTASTSTARLRGATSLRCSITPAFAVSAALEPIHGALSSNIAASFAVGSAGLAATGNLGATLGRQAPSVFTCCE